MKTIFVTVWISLFIAISSFAQAIGNYAFTHCGGLTSITIGCGITTIGEHTFSLCSSLVSIAIPNTVTEIGDWAFDYCRGLNKIRIACSTPPEVGTDTFFDVETATCVLDVPTNSTGAYRKAKIWKEFLNITEFAPNKN